MKIIKKDLLNVLQKCLPGVGDGDIILQGVDTFVFEEGKVYSYNDKISISVELGDDMKDIEGVVKADEFFKLISKLPDSEELSMEIEKDKWIIKGDNLKVELSLLRNSIKEYIKVIEGIEKDWKKLPDDFFEALQCCKLNNNNTNFAGIAVKNDEVLSCNGLMFSWFKMEKKMNTFWIEDSVVNNLLKFDNLKKWSSSEKWLFFYNEGICFTCKKLNDDDFPYDSLINTLKQHNLENKKISGKLPIILKNIVNRASVLSTDLDGDEVVKIIFTEEGIECKSERSTGKYEEKVEWKEKIKGDIKESIEIYIDYNMICYGLEKTDNFYVIEKNIEDRSLVRVVFYGEKFKRLVSSYGE
jgi:hypothetical protein